MTHSWSPDGPRDLTGYTPFPTEVFPPTIRRFVDAGAESIGVDPAFVAVPLLSVCATAIGNTRRAMVKPGWNEPSVLWTAIVAPSGCAKSPAMNLSLSLIRGEGEPGARTWSVSRRQDDPLNLSISLGRGKLSKGDSVSSGERTRNSPSPKPARPGCRHCGVSVGVLGLHSFGASCLSGLERHAREGDSPVGAVRRPDSRMSDR